MALTEILSGIFPALLEIAKAPLAKPSLIWQLAPILCIWILVEFYFGTHKKERLGWNTALSNGISLFWIVISGMQHIFSDVELFTWLKFGLISLIALYSIFIVYISFKHTFKPKLTFLFASPTPLFYFSALVLLFAHDLIKLNITMFIAIALLFIVIVIFVTILKKLLPEMKEEDADKFSSSANEPLDMAFGDTSSSLPSSSDLEPLSPVPAEPSLPQQDPFQQPPGGLEKQITPPNQPPQNNFD